MDTTPQTSDSVAELMREPLLLRGWLRARQFAVAEYEEVAHGDDDAVGRFARTFHWPVRLRGSRFESDVTDSIHVLRPFTPTDELWGVVPRTWIVERCHPRALVFDVPVALGVAPTCTSPPEPDVTALATRVASELGAPGAIAVAILQCPDGALLVDDVRRSDDRRTVAT